MQTELDDLQLVPSTAAAPTKQQPRREALPESLPRIDVRHEPDSTICHCGCQLKRIGEDVSEKLDYTPGVFQVERHVRGKWACVKCQTLMQAPVPAQVIDKGIPTAGLLAQVLVSKYADHAPLYRQEQMFGRAGYAIPRSTLGEWVGVCGVRLQPLVDALKAVLLERPVLHADETPVAMLKPGHGKTHRAYLWTWCTTQYDGIKGVVYDFAETRGGRHAREFIGDWKGKLVCDDYAGYKALFENGIVEAGCMAHARRKFHDLWANHSSQIAGEALTLYGALYDIERDAAALTASERHRIRQARAAPAADASPLADPAPAESTGWVRDGKGDRLQPEAVGGTDPLPRRRQLADRQQLGREPDPAGCPWPLELAVRRLPARRAARGRRYEPDPVRQAQRPRSIPVPEGRPAAAADSARQPDRGTATASVGSA